MTSVFHKTRRYSVLHLKARSIRRTASEKFPRALRMLKMRKGRCPTSGQRRGPLGRASTPPLVRRPLVGPAKSLSEMSVRSIIYVEYLLGITAQHVEALATVVPSLLPIGSQPASRR